MRALTRFAALIGVALGLTGCVFVRDFEEFRPEGYEESGLCQNVGSWPDAPSGADGVDGDTLTFALANSSFGLGAYDWTATGYNVDGYCTYESDQRGPCVPNALHLDGPFGLDNVFGQHVVPRLREAFPDFGNNLQATQATGASVLLIRVSGYDGSGDDSAVDVEIDVSASSPGTVPISATAYVADGRLVAILNSIRLPLPGVGPDVSLTRAHLIADFDGGVMPHATLLGRWRTEDAASSLGDCPGMDTATATALVESIADVSALGSGGGRTCDAISIAIAFDDIMEMWIPPAATMPVPTICD